MRSAFNPTNGAVFVPVTRVPSLIDSERGQDQHKSDNFRQLCYPASPYLAPDADNDDGYADDGRRAKEQGEPETEVQHRLFVMSPIAYVGNICDCETKTGNK